MSDVLWWPIMWIILSNFWPQAEPSSPQISHQIYATEFRDAQSVVTAAEWRVRLCMRSWCVNTRRHKFSVVSVVSAPRLPRPVDRGKWRWCGGCCWCWDWCSVPCHAVPATLPARLLPHPIASLRLAQPNLLWRRLHVNNVSKSSRSSVGPLRRIFFIPHFHFHTNEPPTANTVHRPLCISALKTWSLVEIYVYRLAGAISTGNARESRSHCWKVELERRSCR